MKLQILGVIAAATFITPVRAADPLATGLFRGQPVTYTLSHGRKVFQGDILLDHVTSLRRQADSGRSIGVSYPQYLWPKNAQGVAEIPYIVTSAATNLTAAMQAFNATFSGVIQ